MKAIANVLLSTTIPEVKLEHNGEQLLFSISVFGRQCFTDEFDVFDQINTYWEQLPKEHQDNIFQVYKDIQFGFDNIWNQIELTAYLCDKVKLLVELHNLDNLHDWVAYKSNIIIPHTFDVDYNHSIDNNTSREKTYTRSDYVKLVTLSLTLRIMIPVWGEFISKIRQDSGTQFKEFYAFQLIRESTLLHSIPLNKLGVYIEHMLGADKNNANNTLSGISSEDFGFWLLSLVSVRRLCVGDIRGNDPKANLITFIYKFIIQKIRNTDNNVENMVKPKTIDDKGNGEENKTSTLERYKIKSNISLGEIVELEHSIFNIEETVYKLTSNLDPDLLNRSIQTSKILINEKILDPQMTLLRLVFKPVISPRGLMYLTKPSIVQALGALEAVLWARGHKYLALIASSYANISDKEMIISPVDSKIRVPKQLSEDLNKLYPYTRNIKSAKEYKQVNLAAKSVDLLTDNLMMYSWKPTAHDDMLQEVFGSLSRRLPIKPDIKIYLTNLILELGSRTWV